MGIAVKCRSRQAPGGLNRCGDLELLGMIQVLLACSAVGVVYYLVTGTVG